MLGQLSLDSRVEIWSRALYALQDFPFTGVGLGTFRRVVNLLYPLFLVPPDVDIAHAHNIFCRRRRSWPGRSDRLCGPVDCCWRGRVANGPGG